MQRGYNTIKTVAILASILMFNTNAMEENKKKSEDQKKEFSFVSCVKENAVPIVLTTVVVGGIIVLTRHNGSSQGSQNGPAHNVTKSLVRYTGKKIIDKSVGLFLYVGLPCAVLWRYQNGKAAEQVRKDTDEVVNIHKETAQDLNNFTKEAKDLCEQFARTKETADKTYTLTKKLYEDIQKLRKTYTFEPEFEYIDQVLFKTNMISNMLSSVDFAPTNNMVQELLNNNAFEGLWTRIQSLEASVDSSLVISRNIDTMLTSLLKKPMHKNKSGAGAAYNVDDVD